MNLNELKKAIERSEFLLEKWANEMPPPSLKILQIIAFLRPKLSEIKEKVRKGGTKDLGELPKFQKALQEIQQRIDRMSSGKTNN